ncbi:hypothetical protein QTI66_37420 [Variovorax sp. J22R133]|uniref:hypothetical protein n=1 Tax=Variovorax brevis TaxID=3053503 RepID=UPI0025750D43|nr:hypothetical protein [Variovorax sp. J22R133]MDM0117781.1 hypothetical protein [Variovorax sp. J22R133]
MSVARAERVNEALWFEWLALAGVLGFATWLLGLRGVLALLLAADPTGITLVIVIVFAGSTLWCGARTRELERQRRWAASTPLRDGWGADYLRTLGQPQADSGEALDLLLEQTHGPHATAWWVNGIQLKLGLLGKVIGFSILALTIGKVRSFDPSESQELLRSLTSGLGVALLTQRLGIEQRGKPP